MIAITDETADLIISIISENLPDDADKATHPIEINLIDHLIDKRNGLASKYEEIMGMKNTNPFGLTFSRLRSKETERLLEMKTKQHQQEINALRKISIVVSRDIAYNIWKVEDCKKQFGPHDWMTADAEKRLADAREAQEHLKFLFENV